ncbi:aprataxin and PNK-like factor isoform X2 [Neoarius graeffei]|uniref:aprataxin and PNK-like factor isoform X2 n=1 Tax=Neoarius graeffei TaxID=443677 RepID=UPI00298D4359|nr:aprataxin and PNK-like factor isoform X2 [Neoarius graeffei]
MPSFELEQVDEGGGRREEPIDLPHGDSVIGRGPFLGVSDKRVSRNHGILENVDGQLRLKPTHVNPCFVQTSLDASPQPLEKDRWHCLKDGSIFSLLPGKYIYRVHAVAEESTPTNSQGFEEKEKEVMGTVSETDQNSKSSRSCEETLAYTPQAKSTPSFTYESTMRDETHTAGPAACNQVGVDSPCKYDTPDPLTPRKKRLLPDWMMDVAPAVPSTSSAKAAKRHPKPTVRSTPSSKRSAGPKRPRARLPSLSGDEEEEKEVEEDEEEECSKAPRKRARKLESDPEESQDQAPVSKSSQETPPEDEDASVAQEKEKECKRAEGATSRPESSRKSQTDGQQKAEVQRRTPCPYGTSCYRKNPIHFQECSHPGDNDYEEKQNDKDDEDDDRPECPYGTDCYRKNPLHKKEYKHTKPPAPVKDDNDDEDEDQYENSFINDDSEEEDEDMDEDSDYVPESDDDEKEDIKQLQTEAKAFLQRKK